jgi:hypothetical protein
LAPGAGGPLLDGAAHLWTRRKRREWDLESAAGEASVIRKAKCAGYKAFF